ncbi:Copper binding protein, plastocyanin/azurin family [hydrothermal vent metagenome]|uniref:Copper binding protein, plastocyanin/azurin family n=1 Tax=hydrothermal vent metagenome TaxID=652676 RepID=A0A3B0V7W8_9ZZZZ
MGIIKFMQRRLSFILLSLVVAIGLAALVIFNAAQFSPIQAAQPEAIIAPELLEALADGAAVRFIADMATTADLSKIATVPTGEHTAVLDTLQQTAVSSQAAPLNAFNNLAKAGAVTAVRPLWIVNSIAASGNLTAVLAIANTSGVRQVRLDIVVDIINPSSSPTATLLAPTVAVVTGPVASWGIQQINAPSVWHGLGIDGGGVTVAIMDTGVDWQHPDLAENYRGNLGGGLVDHSGNWYNAVFPTDTIPIDNIGHGTHVAGTAVGHNGIGVAPGAQWIGVNVADPLGFIFESDVHAGFEWLLAPNGDVSLAPDVVNNSWGSTLSSDIFAEDIIALQAANIMVVFSAGNSGPFPATIGYPGGYPEVLAVGASDELDEVAWFSSRGPSAQTEEPKPWIVAPGTQILSSLPDGEYGLFNGTSMAAPHVVGTIGLLLDANPSLTRGEINQILAETAVPISTTHPNYDSGWGRLDAYAAVSGQTAVGWLAGQVTSGGQPLPNVVVTITTPSGGMLPFVTDVNGRYAATLQSGSYSVSSQPFGYTQSSASGLGVTAGQTTTENIALTLLPNGQVQGIVRVANSYAPLPNALVEVVNTPVQVLTDGSGTFNLTLPEGSYELVVTKTGYERQRAELLIVANTAVVQYFFLTDAPTILLVDGGQWYFSSQEAPYAEALTTLNYSFDIWTIRHPIEDVPMLDDLAAYDTVIWSNPLDSPGFLGVNDVITDYLGLGGQLFISGQHLGSLDGVGVFTQLWWYRDLAANLLGKTAVSDTISGSGDSLFAGLTFSLNGGSSSNNQTAPDVTAPRADNFSEPAFEFPDGRSAGLTAGVCTPFRMVYLGFGLEGVAEAADRAAILERSFTYFAQPRRQFGVRFSPDSIDEIGIPNEQMVYTVTVLNQSELLTDTFQLSLSGASWASSLLTKTMTLGPCQIGQMVLTIDVPPDLPPDSVDSLQITAVSSNNPATTAQLLVLHKTPGRILFVDDDRWYDQTDEIAAALDSLGFVYDRWDTGHASDQRNGPPLSLLREYNFVIWYTGYDWFQPITNAENEALEAYLAQGGRLFLTSQDFLYYHYQTKLAQTYFGVADYLETVAPSQLIASGEMLLPLPLDFDPYQNHGDGIIPAAHSQPFFWHDRALPAGTATAGDDWRAILLAVPFETITPTQQAQAMNRVMGWLSDLGDSSFSVDARVGQIGEPRSYTLTVKQIDAGLSNTIWLTNTLPAGLELLPGSIGGGAVYDAASRQLTWNGTLPSGGSQIITYQATPTGLFPVGHLLENVVELLDGRNDLRFSYTTNIWLSAPDVVATITAVPNQPLVADTFTYTVGLQNVGLAAASQISTVVSLPNTFNIVTDTLSSTAGSAAVGDRRLYWQGDLGLAESVTMTLVLTRAITAVPQWVAATALVDDGMTNPAFFTQWEYLPVYSSYFPIMFQANKP